MKNKILRKLCILFSLLMVLSLAGCGSDYSTSTSDSNSYGRDDLEWNSEAETASNYNSSDVSRSTQLRTDNSGALLIDRIKRDSEVPMGKADTWSVFVYLCGTDLESVDGSATDDLKEMMKVGSNSNVNIIVETGGAKSWSRRGISAKKLQRYMVNNGDLELLCESDRANMGTSQTLYSFLSWGVENYPAEHMAVIFWNHGSGSINGVCFDELYHDDSLYLTEIEEAFTRVYDEMTCRFEFVGFDACLMATIESANILAPHAKYMIASQELESGYGWDYKSVLSYIDKNPDCTGADVGRVVGDSYYNFCTRTGEADDATISVVDLEQVDDFLKAFNDVSKNLYKKTGDVSDLSQICRAFSKSANYGGNNQSEGYTNMVDLGDVLKKVNNSVGGCDKAIEKLSQMVVYMKNGDNCKNATGVSIYYPLSVQGSSELNVFRNICVSPYYMNLVETVAYGSSGQDVSGYDGDDWSDSDDYYEDNYGFNDYFGDDDNDDGYFDGWDDWFDTSDDGWYNTESDYIDFEVEPYVNNECYYTMILSQDSLDYVSAIYFALFKDDGSDDLIYLGNDNAVDYDLDTGEVMDCFTGEWPMLPDGQNVAIYLVEEGNGYNVYSIPVLLNNEEVSIRVKMEYDDEEVFGDFDIIGIWEGISESGQAGRKNIEIKAGDVICPIYETSNYYTGEEGIKYGKKYKVGSNFGITVGTLPDADYYYSYEIVDIFGTSVFTEETVFTMEDGELFGYPDENADDYDSQYSDGFFDDFGGREDWGYYGWADDEEDDDEYGWDFWNDWDDDDWDDDDWDWDDDDWDWDDDDWDWDDDDWDDGWGDSDSFLDWIFNW